LRAPQTHSYRADLIRAELLGEVLLSPPKPANTSSSSRGRTSAAPNRVEWVPKGELALTAKDLAICRVQGKRIAELAKKFCG
jgi:hypothetical protein